MNENKFYTVYICQSIEAECEQDAIDKYVENMNSGSFDHQSVIAEFDSELTEDLLAQK